MKKNVLFILIFLFFSQIIFAQTNNLNLFDAIKQNKAKAIFGGNDKSVHYIKPMTMEIQNLGMVDLPIVLPAGSYFVSEPAEYQDILVTKTLLFTLKPSEKKTLEISGNCTEPSNRAPNGKTSYVVGKSPKDELVDFAKFIDKEQLWELSETQSAVWFLCKDDKDKQMNADIRQIYGYSGEEKGRKIRNQLAKIKNITLDLDKNGEIVLERRKYQILIDGKVTQQYTQVKTETYKGSNCEMWGGGMYSYHKPCKMQIGMFNEKGVLVREIYYNEKETATPHTVKYAYDCDAYTDNVYYFKYIQDGIVVKSIALKKG